MAEDQHYDVVIIGTGAGGGTLGHRLATSGAKVLWLERGPFLPRERDNWETRAVFVRGKYLASDVWSDRHGREFQPEQPASRTATLAAWRPSRASTPS